jgi:farnesyl diphosphate synthase
MGAIIVGKEDLGAKLYDFGMRLGLLFQIQDDILDVTQSSDEAGKLTNNDEAKNSFVTILGLERAMEEADTLAATLLEEMEGFDANLREKMGSLLTSYINRHKH